MKEKWSHIKETVINYIKFQMLTALMSIGFWFIYSLIWFGVGLPQTDWALWITFGLALFSEWLYIKWVSN